MSAGMNISGQAPDRTGMVVVLIGVVCMALGFAVGYWSKPVPEATVEATLDGRLLINGREFDLFRLKLKLPFGPNKVPDGKRKGDLPAGDVAMLPAVIQQDDPPPMPRAKRIVRPTLAIETLRDALKPVAADLGKPGAMDAYARLNVELAQYQMMDSIATAGLPLNLGKAGCDCPCGPGCACDPCACGNVKTVLFDGQGQVGQRGNPEILGIDKLFDKLMIWLDAKSHEAGKALEARERSLAEKWELFKLTVGVAGLCVGLPVIWMSISLQRIADKK